MNELELTNHQFLTNKEWWIKECPNQIYQKENDYQKVKVQCQEKHTRMVCLEHANKLEINKEEFKNE
jgi:hypothetical protein